MPHSTPKRPRDETATAGRKAPRGEALTASVLLDDAGIERAIVRVAHELVERSEDPELLYLVAIPNGGVPLARRLAKALRDVADLTLPVGVLDTTLYRDDLISSGRRPALRRTEMPTSVDGHVVVFVDDVVKTGRTIRAAMDALKDFGRPRAIQVAALIDRGHRELPIKLDYVGKNVPTRSDQEILMREAPAGSEELEVVLFEEAGEGGEASSAEGAA